MPAEFGPGPGRVGALIEQQDLGEVVAQPGPGFIIGTRDRARGADGDRGRLRQLGDGGVHSIADDVAAAGRLVFQDAPEEIRQVRDVYRRPVLLARAEHDQVAGFVPGRAEKQPGNPAPAVAVGDAGDDHGSAHVRRAEHPAFDRLLPRHQRGRVEGRRLGDRSVGPVDPQAADLEVGLAGAAERVDHRVDHGGVQVRAGGVAGTGRVDGTVRIAEQSRDRWPVVEVDHDRCGASGGDGVRLGVVADERSHLVAVLVQIRQYVRSDETGCAGEYYFHGRRPPAFAAWTCSFNRTLGRYNLNCQVNLSQPFDLHSRVARIWT